MNSFRVASEDFMHSIILNLSTKQQNKTETTSTQQLHQIQTGDLSESEYDQSLEKDFKRSILQDSQPENQDDDSCLNQNEKLSSDSNSNTNSVIFF